MRAGLATAAGLKLAKLAAEGSPSATDLGPL